MLNLVLTKMFLVVTVFWGFVALIAGGRSLHADYIEELVKTHAFDGRVSDNILEDALLEMPSLVRKYGYPFEEHFVTTKDGYILGLHRIPHGRHANSTIGNKPIVFMMHGLISSSADHVTMGPGSAMAYILADEGFDVWMGNARGNTFSRRHRRLNPDALLNIDFWQFSWDEIGNIDLPAMIDYVLEYTGNSALHYLGFSQGTTVFFVMSSLRPEYNRKIISMQALAPVAYMGHNRHPIFRPLAPFAETIQKLLAKIGVGELLSNHPFFSWLGENFCIDGAITQPLCSKLLFLIVGFNEDQHNATMLPVKLGHAPAGCSARQLVHYAQSMLNKDFRRYDHGLVGNLINYGRPSPPWYDLSRISAPVFLHYAVKDPFTHVNDINRLFRELGNPMGLFKVQDPNFSHGDFMWAIDLKSLFFDRVISLMRIMEN